MQDLDTIVKQNREAARKGVKNAPKLGAGSVKPEPVVVFDSRTLTKLEEFDSEWDACTKYRQEQLDGVVVIYTMSEAQEEGLV